MSGKLDVDALPEPALPELTLPPEILALMASFETAGAGEPETGDAASPEAGEGMDEAVLELPAVLDITAAAPLHAALLAHRGAPLCIDGAGVKRLGGQCLQLLVSAGQTFAADSVPIRLQGASDALRRDLALFGIADPFQPGAAR